MDHNEEGLNTKGLNNDQDLKHYDKGVEQINYDELHSFWGRARGEVTNGQSEGLSIILLVTKQRFMAGLDLSRSWVEFSACFKVTFPCPG